MSLFFKMYLMSQPCRVLRGFGPFRIPVLHWISGDTGLSRAWTCFQWRFLRAKVKARLGCKPLDFWWSTICGVVYIHLRSPSPSRAVEGYAWRQTYVA